MADTIRPRATAIAARPRRRSALVALAFSTLLSDTPMSAATGQTEPAAALAVDVAISQAIVEADGTPMRPSTEPTIFRLERVHDASGWLTVLTYPATPAGLAHRAKTNPLDGARIEYADGAAHPHVYDKDGRLNTRLSGESDGPGLPVGSGAERWVDTLLAKPHRRDERRRALTREYGPPASRTASHDRYLSRDGDVEEEVLAEPRSGIVLQVTRSRGGVLEARTTFEYERLSDGTLFRRKTQSEEVLDGPHRRRSVCTIELSNLTIGTGR